MIGKGKKTHEKHPLHLHFTDEEETVVEVRPFIPRHTHSKQQTEHSSVDLPVSDCCSTAPGCLPHKQRTNCISERSKQSAGWGFREGKLIKAEKSVKRQGEDYSDIKKKG